MLALRISSHVLIFRVMEIRALEVRQVECHLRKVLMVTTKMNKIWSRNMDGIKTTKICPFYQPHQNQHLHSPRLIRQQALLLKPAPNLKNHLPIRCEVSERRFLDSGHVLLNVCRNEVETALIDMK